MDEKNLAGWMPEPEDFGAGKAKAAANARKHEFLSWDGVLVPGGPAFAAPAGS